MHAGGTAASLDGIYYEIFHLLPTALASLLYHWFWLAKHQPLTIIKDTHFIVDLISFIDKANQDETADGKRPLGNPPTSHKLLSSAGLATVVPLWAPLLHQAQTGFTAGEACIYNFKRLRHFLFGGEGFRRHNPDKVADFRRLLAPECVLLLDSMMKLPWFGASMHRTVLLADQ